MDDFVKAGGLGVIAVLSFACEQFEVSSVTPQQIIQFAFENKEPSSMYKHINTAVLCTYLLISKHNFCFLIDYEMHYFVLVSSRSFCFSQREMLTAETAESKVPSSCLPSARVEKLMTTVCTHNFLELQITVLIKYNK